MPLTLMMLSLLQALGPTSAAWKERHHPDMPPVPPCAFASHAKEVSSLAELPEQVRTEITRLFKGGGGIADSGGEFNSTDVIEDKAVPHNRFLRAYLTNDVWFVWWEAGGIVHTLYTLALTRRREEGQASAIFRVAPGIGFTGNLCAGSKAFLDGARAASAF